MFGLIVGDRRGVVERNLDCASAAFVACVRARVIDQNVTHHLCADCEEVRAILPFKSPLLTGEFYICFIDQSGCLQCVAGAFLAHLPAGDLAQLSMNERKKSVECRLVTFSPIGK